VIARIDPIVRVISAIAWTARVVSAWIAATWVWISSVAVAVGPAVFSGRLRPGRADDLDQRIPQTPDLRDQPARGLVELVGEIADGFRLTRDFGDPAEHLFGAVGGLVDAA
jgi:hypothetical protein